MGRSRYLIVFLIAGLSAVAQADKFNYCTGCVDFTGSGTAITSSTLPGGSTSYIQNTETLQAGATFFVSSGTVIGPLRVQTITAYDYSPSDKFTLVPRSSQFAPSANMTYTFASSGKNLNLNIFTAGSGTGRFSLYDETSATGCGSGGFLFSTPNAGGTALNTVCISAGSLAAADVSVTYGVTAGSMTVTNLTASQFVKTDGSKGLASYDLLNATQTWTGTNSFISSSTFIQATTKSTSTLVIRDTDASSILWVDNSVPASTDGTWNVVASTNQGYTVRTATATPGNFMIAISTNGFLVTNGSTPTMGSCGSTPNGSVVGDDNQGDITVGGGAVTSCAMNFSYVHTGCTMSCQLSTNSTSVTGDVASLSTSAVTFGFSLSLGGGHIYYRCGGYGSTCK